MNVKYSYLLVHLGAYVPPARPGSWEPEEFISGVLKAIKKKT